MWERDGHSGLGLGGLELQSLGNSELNRWFALLCGWVVGWLSGVAASVVGADS